MADVLIDFKVDYTQLDAAIDVLEKTGQVDAKVAKAFKETNQAITQQGAALQKTAQSFKGPITSIDQLDKRSKKFFDSFIKGIEDGLAEGLSIARKEIDAMKAKLAEYEAAGKGSVGATSSLKKELKDLTAQIAQAKAAGSPIDPALIERAGELKDAIADANAEIANAGSDTRGLDNLIGVAQAAAGGFAVLQGTAALFGDESEEIQKTLLKVNAAMSVLQGLQSIQNALQKEGAITLAISNARRQISVVQTNLETAAQSRNIVVKNLATAAQWALNLAMSANPIGLLITALVAIAAALVVYTRNTRNAAEATGELRGAVKNLGEELDKSTDAISRNTRREIIDLKKAGAAESEIIKARIDGLQNQTSAIQAAYDRDKAILDKGLGDAKDRAELQKALEDRRKQLIDNRIALQEMELERQKALADEADALAAKRKEAEEKELEAQKQRVADSIARLKTEQLLVDEGTLTYNRLQAAIVTLQGTYDALGQSAARSTLAIKTAAKESELLLRDQSSAVDATLNVISKKTIDTSKALKGFTDLAVDGINTQLDDTKKSFQDFVNEIVPEIQKGLDAIGQIGQSLNAISQERQQNQQIEIENSRKEVDALLEAGAITEKEAEARQKRIDRVEAQQRTKAAQQAKQLAIFQAVISTAQAVVNALATPPAPVGIALAAVVGALGAAQIAAIASRPIPRFASGKIKGGFEGVGMWGEAGTEMKVDKHGNLQFASKPTISYIGKDDVIYSASKTRDIVASTVRPESNARAERMDYDKIGKAIAKHIPAGNQTNIDMNEHGFRVWTEQNQTRKNYMDKRYNSGL